MIHHRARDRRSRWTLTIIRQELDSKTKTSTLFAVIVMTDDQKSAAQQHFNTPLVFNIQEAKGLEYENIILYNFLSKEEISYHEISKGVSLADLELDIKYARNKDKTDKSIEIYKFYVNALYVAITRAIKNLYWIESNPKQPLLELLSLHDTLTDLHLDSQNSNLDTWRQEAHKLELQGKQEQADRIRTEILKQKTPDWLVIDLVKLAELKQKAFEAKDKKAKLAIFEYSLIYEDSDISNNLLLMGFKAAADPTNGLNLLQQKYYSSYSFKKTDNVFKQVDKYGPDFRNNFNQTPLMVAAWMGNIEVVKKLLYLGADTEKVDNNGLNAFQIALAQMYRNETYSKNKLINIYELLKPSSINIKVDGHLIKIDNRKMEFLMLNLMIALFYRKIISKPADVMITQLFFNTQYFISTMEHLPDSIFPVRRRQRNYVSNILAKNTINVDDKKSYKLFYRVRHGNYIFNPNLIIKVEKKWINIYDLLSIDKLSMHYPISNDRHMNWHHTVQEEMKKFYEFEESNFKELQEASDNVKQQFKDLVTTLRN